MMDEKQKGKIDSIRHYWFKGYIPDKYLFRFLEPLIFDNVDVFQDLEFLKVLLRGVFKINRVFKTHNQTNNYIQSEYIDEQTFDNLYISEYQRLKRLIGKKTIVKCDYCGKSANAEIKIMDEDIPDYGVEAGRIYWEKICPHCNNLVERYSEVV